MTVITWQTRMIVAALAIFSMLVHSGGDTASLVGISTGGALLLLGLWAMFRIASVGGFLIMTGVSALFMDLETMTDAQSVMFATVGLLVPSIAAGWTALTAEDEHKYVLNLKTRQVAIASAFAIVCMASVPAAMILSGLFVPSISITASAMVEAAVMLLAASIPVVYFFTVEPEHVEINEDLLDSDESLA